MRIVFHLYGAYVGQLNGVTKVGWWPSDPLGLYGPVFDTTRVVPCDLSMTPSAARQGLITPQQIQCDNYRSEGGLNGIGPRFPGGQMIGPMWLSDLYAQTIGSPAYATAGMYDYEQMMTMYFERELGDRTFIGFHARIVQTQGSLSLVEIWNGGTAQSSTAPAGRWWLDVAAVSDPTYTTISPTNPVGALFLDRDTVGQLPLFWPKKPPGYGRDSFATDTE